MFDQTDPNTIGSSTNVILPTVVGITGPVLFSISFAISCTPCDFPTPEESQSIYRRICPHDSFSPAEYSEQENQKNGDDGQDQRNPQDIIAAQQKLDDRQY